MYILNNFLFKNNIFRKLFLKFFFYQNKNYYYFYDKKFKILNNKYLKKINNKIYIETKIKINSLGKLNKKILNNIKDYYGGSANTFLIYFFVRLLRPNSVVETGVAAGFSSQSILEALKKNKKGKLYSSDLRYYRVKVNYKPGFIVNKNLKKNWNLYTHGDLKNIIQIKKKIKKIDLLHYDSEKYYFSKKIFFNSVKNILNENTVIIFDDIQDDLFFYDFIKKHSDKKFFIFKYKNKLVGTIFPKNFNSMK